MRPLRFFTLLLSALALSTQTAHLLELAPKMALNLDLYSTINASLYRYFAIVGGAWQVSSIILAIVLAVAVRTRAGVFAWTLWGAILLAIAFVTWAAVVAPVNSHVAAAWRDSPQSAAAAWAGLRARWEYGHAAGFVFMLAGFSCLLISTLTDSGARLSTNSPDVR